MALGTAPCTPARSPPSSATAQGDWARASACGSPQKSGNGDSSRPGEPGEDNELPHPAARGTRESPHRPAAGWEPGEAAQEGSRDAALG